MTEGIKYIGSKRTLIPHILSMVSSLPVRTVLDGFSGTTRVSQALADGGYRVISNDTAAFSQVFATCYLLNGKPAEHYRPMIDHLNGLPGEDGWFTEHYGGAAADGCSVQVDGRKRPWQVHVTRKLDAIRPEIDRIAPDPVEKAVLITSLVLALDRVDSTVGHQVSYLRQWSRRSYGSLVLEVPAVKARPEGHCVRRADIFDVLEDAEADLAYFDPPYGSANDRMPPSRVRYASYYHLWNTVCLNDRPALAGAAARRADAGDVGAASEFEDFRRDGSGRFRVLASIERLIRKARARWVLLSYGNAGRVTREDLLETVRGLGLQVTVKGIDYRRNVMASMKWTGEWTAHDAAPTREMLFLIGKG